MNGKRLWRCVQMTTCVCISAASMSGCSRHNVEYEAFIRNEISPTEYAASIQGRFDEARALFDQAQLPHNSIRQKCELRCAALEKLTDQMGSKDYILIGVAYGEGSSKATIGTLKAALCEEAAEHGGDVVMFFKIGVRKQPFVYSTPGYTTTNVYGSSYCYGGYIYGNTTGYTTYRPGQTVSGVLHLPHASGLVFKFVRGAAERRKALLQLDDSALARLMPELEELNSDSLAFEESLKRMDDLIAKAAKPDSE